MRIVRLLCAFLLTANLLPLCADEPKDSVTARDKVASKTGPPTAKAGRGRANIDGRIEEAWSSAKPVPVHRSVESLLRIGKSDMATAKVRFLWDGEYLYALFEVTDSQLSSTADNPWDQDSVEIFIDQNGNRSTSYEKDDAQYRVSIRGDMSGQGPGYAEEDLFSATKRTQDGYLVELGLRLDKVHLESGAGKVGLELQVNDDHGSGYREAVAKWNHTTDSSWEDTSTFGTLVLPPADVKK